MTIKQQLRTVLVFTKLSTKRFFRDRLAQFFSILFPLIFLFVFGSLNSGNGNPSFHIAVLNRSKSPAAKALVQELNQNKVFKIDSSVTTEAEAKDKMNKSQLEATIILPPDFGITKPGDSTPSGHAQVIYTQNNDVAGGTVTSIIDTSFRHMNWHLALGNSTAISHTDMPFTVVGQPLNEKSLTAFDYTFAGLLGFSIIGLGIFGPVNVFPELKKQGILRRLHTTPLRTWQYFMATMFSQAITGILSIAIQFAVAIKIFHLKVNGSYIEIFIFTILSIFMILGIGLAIGGWAKNERQAAPLSNIVVFPMLFLSGTFFPRFLMPHWLQTVTTFLPLTPVIDGLRLLTTEGAHLIDLGPQLALMAAWSLVIYSVAFRVFKWE